MRRTTYYHFSNDLDNKTGVVTLAARRKEGSEKGEDPGGFSTAAEGYIE